MRETDKGTCSVVAFKIDTEEFAVNIARVQEINRCADITRIPHSARHVDGVMNLRGKIIPVVDLRTLLGFQQKASDTQSRIIVMELDGMVAGFVVDSVSEVVDLPESAIQAPPALGGEIAMHYVAGVGKVDERLLILLNVQEMFKTGEDGEPMRDCRADRIT